MSIAVSDAPTASDRHWLASRDHDLDTWLAPAGEDAVRPHVAALMLSLRHPSEDAQSRQILQRIIAADLADLPIFAVEAACREFRQGRAGDGRWMPTQAEIRVVALRIVEPYQAERVGIRGVLGVTVRPDGPSEAERVAMAARCKALFAETVAKADPFAGPHRPLPMSVELRASLGEVGVGQDQPPAISEVLRSRIGPHEEAKP